MKIVAVNDVFPPLGWLGPETQVLYRLLWLRTQGWDAAVVTSGESDAYHSEVTRGIRVYHVKKFERRSNRKTGLMTAIRWGIGSIFDLVVFLRCMGILKKENPNLVWARCVDNLSLAPLVAAKALRIPSALTPADFWWLCHIADPPATCPRLDGKQCASCLRDSGYVNLKEGLILELLNKALEFLGKIKRYAFDHLPELVIFPNNFLRINYANTLGHLPKNIVLNNPGIIDVIDTPMEEIKHEIGVGDERVVLYVGALTSLHRVDLLMRAFPEIKKQVSNTRLYVIGDGPEMDNLKSLADGMGCNDSILFRGLIKDRAVMSMYYKVSEVVVATMQGQYPISYSAVVMEALAHGKPVVVTEEGGQSVIQDGINGYRVGYSPLEIAEGVVKVLTDRTTDFSGNNRDLYEREFSYKSVFKRYGELFSNMAKRKKGIATFTEV